jgi:hypothetical protein
VGYTKMITAFVCYNIAHRRRKQALWQPTDDDRDNYVKTEIDPLRPDDRCDVHQQGAQAGQGHLRGDHQVQAVSGQRAASAGRQGGAGVSTHHRGRGHPG